MRMEAKLLTVLLSWTVNLLSYPHPDIVPELSYKPHQFLLMLPVQEMKSVKLLHGMTTIRQYFLMIL